MTLKSYIESGASDSRLGPGTEKGDSWSGVKDMKKGQLKPGNKARLLQKARTDSTSVDGGYI